MKKNTLFLFFLFFSFYVHANDFFWYNISNYGVREYSGDIQNWGGCIDQENDLIYIANNSGLLSFDGNNWMLNALPQQQNLRAVHKVGNRIYTAGDNCIGYWIKNEDGTLSYTSLEALIDHSMISEDSYWSIADDGRFVYFQSFSQILQYDGSSFKQISKDCHMLLQQCGKDVFVHRLFGGIFQLKNGAFQEFVPAIYLKDQEMKFFLKIGKDRYLFGTNVGRIYLKESKDQVPKEWIYDSTLLKPYVMDCGALISNDRLAIGTLGGGIFIYDLNGKLLEKIDRYNQLKNNTVHRLLYYRNNLWATLDNGISNIQVNPLMRLWKSSNDIGNFHTACFYKGHYYIGTNEGLFVNEGFNQVLSKIGDLGEVMSFKAVKGDLLCGTNRGCYRLNKGNWEWIAPIKGIYHFEYVADNGKEYLVACTYLYITFFEYINGQWRLHSQVANLTNTFEQIMSESIRLLWAIHPQKGIFKVRVDEKLEKADEIVQYKDRPGLTDYRRISIQRIDGITYFFSPEGVYNYSPDTDQFVLNNKLTRDLSAAKGFNWVAHAKDNEYWVCRGHELFLYRITLNGAVEIGRESFSNYNLTQLKNKVYVSHLKDDLYLFSSVDGVVSVNAALIKKAKHYSDKPIRLSMVSYYMNGKWEHASLDEENQINIPYNATNVRFMVAQPISTSSNLLKFRLENGDENAWSDWVKNGTIEFSKLLAGEHHLVIQDFWGNKKTLKINVFLPFYLSRIALVLYILLLLFVVFMLTRKRYQRKKEKMMRQYQLEQHLKDEQIVKLTNEKLKETINAQKNEINNKLRAISQKQELLLAISDELDRQKEFLGDRYPRNLYDKLKKIVSRGMSLDKDFILFQNYYQEVNRDFLVFLKSIHPELSSQDLKFCCLIRSNLSTKDIAAVLNITQKSVELKRYRLKRKLDLEGSLSDYLLGVMP